LINNYTNEFSCKKNDDTVTVALSKNSFRSFRMKEGGGGGQYMPNKPRKFIEIVAEMFEN
jgi:hypothetical protein